MLARLRDERGVSLVIVLLFLPVLILFCSFVIDMGNWFVHKRHLQLQADAAAFAGADSYTSPCTTATNTAIKTNADNYGGVASGSQYNHQVGSGSGGVQVLYNSPTYPGQSTPVDGTVRSGSGANDFCGAAMVDVKMTETNVPWFFKAAGVPFINAHARVEIKQETQAAGAEALAVSDSAPVAAKAYFVDESQAPLSANWILASKDLTNSGTNGQGQQVWSNAAAPVSVAITKPNMGVVIALSGNKADTTCGDTNVQCFDTSATGTSLLHIQGWTATGTPTLTAPIARSVSLMGAGGTCTDGYFVTAGGCTVPVTAWLDYGKTNTNGVTIKPSFAGAQGAALTPGATSGTAVQWTGTATIPAGAGANQLDLSVSCNKNATNAACNSNTSATITNVARPYVAGTHSGTIQAATVTEPSSPNQDAHTYEVCEAADNNSCSHDLVVTVNVAGSLADAQSFSDPLYVMRLGSSQSDSVSCGGDPKPSGSDYRTNLANGCTGPFKINTSDPQCTNAGTSPYDCIVLTNGVQRGPLTQGLQDHIVNSPPAGTRYYCQNNWTSSTGAVPVIPKDDSRIINVFVMPYGSTDAAGNPLLNAGYVPIQDFATFYVTGFDSDPCATDDTVSGTSWVVGHFIKYVNTLNDGSGGTTTCTSSSLGTCVAVLTE